MRPLLILALVLAVLAGFGGGWIARENYHPHRRATTTQRFDWNKPSDPGLDILK